MSAPVLVTGTAGGVGAVAIAILRHRGFQVTASTGRPEQANHLKGLGGDRHHRTQRARKTAGKRALGGRHDAANSTTLANVLSMTPYGGTVGWRAAWICRPRSSRLSCVVLRFSASAPSYVRWPIGNGVTTVGERPRSGKACGHDEEDRACRGDRGGPRHRRGPRSRSHRG